MWPSHIHFRAELYVGPSGSVDGADGFRDPLELMSTFGASGFVRAICVDNVGLKFEEQMKRKAGQEFEPTFRRNMTEALAIARQ